MSVSFDTMLARVAGNISRYNMFPLGCRVGVAVSGGADSVCLLHVLRELAPRWNLHLSVVHVEHGIRGDESRADAEFVRALAAQFGLEFHCRAGDLPAEAKRTRENLEQAAREFRKSFFSELIRAGKLDRIATAHTRDDQAETVLFRLLRGTGIAGLAGIYPVTAAGFVRPFLDLSRADVEAYLREHGIAWREDASNRDLSYSRNRIRHELLPMLRERYNPAIADALVRTATLARNDEEYWQTLVGTADIRDGAAFFSARKLADTQPAVARRLVRNALKAIRGSLRQISFDDVETVLRLAASDQGSARFQMLGVEVWRSFAQIRIRAAPTQSPPRPDFELEATVPGEVAIQDYKLRLHFDLRAAETSFCDRVEDVLSWEKTLGLIQGSGSGLRVRNWRPGDRYRPATGREEKIKQMFQDHAVPVWERSAWPVVTAGDQILWTRKFGVALAFAPDAHTSTILRINDEYVSPA